MNVFKEIMIEFKKNFSVEDTKEKGNTLYEFFKSKIETHEDKIVLEDVTLINYQFHYEGKTYNTQFVTKEAFIYSLFLAIATTKLIMKTMDDDSLEEIDESVSKKIITQLIEEGILTRETIEYKFMYLFIILIIKFVKEY